MEGERNLQLFRAMDAAYQKDEGQLRDYIEFKKKEDLTSFKS